MTWCFSEDGDHHKQAPGICPRSDEHRNIIAYTTHDEAGRMPLGACEWTSKAEGSPCNITIELVPHPENNVDPLQFAASWSAGLPQTAQELKDMCDNYIRQANALLDLENRHNVEDMVKEALAPPTHAAPKSAADGGDDVQSVKEYYETMEVLGNGVPEDMTELGPVVPFALKALDQDPSSPQSGFEHTLANQSPADAAFKDDWASLVQHTLRKAQEIRRNMTKTLGFTKVDELCTRILHNQTGHCDRSRLDFFNAQEESERKLQPCVAEVERAQANYDDVKNRALEIAVLEQLCCDRKAISGADEKNASELRRLLLNEGYTDCTPRGEDGKWHEDLVQTVRLLHV